MAGRRLPEGTRVQLVFLAAVAGVVVLGGLVLTTLAPDADRRVQTVVLGLAPAVVLLTLMGLAGWVLVRRVRRNRDLRRRQLNGRAQATLSIATLVAYTVASVTRAVLDADGWAAAVLIIIVVGVIVFVPAFMLARRFDPRVHWFRRPDPAPEENHPSPRFEHPG